MKKRTRVQLNLSVRFSEYVRLFDGICPFVFREAKPNKK